MVTGILKAKAQLLIVLELPVPFPIPDILISMHSTVIRHEKTISGKKKFLYHIAISILVQGMIDSPSEQ